MNFFQAQDTARKQSRVLVALFSIAVAVLVLLTNICVALFVLYSNPEYSLSTSGDISFQQHDFFSWCIRLFSILGWQKGLWTSLLVVGIILIATMFKWLELKQGGRKIAESLGGTLLQGESKNVHEKRLLNIVEEIAIAAGIPVPPVYLLKNEAGINAFAAGLSHEDAVIGITQGALQAFNREQLQGVIAHEFSHILNGDMRLNIQLVAVLHGILMIAESGRFFMRMGSSGSRQSSSWNQRLGGSGQHKREGNIGGIFIIFGLCLWLLGLTGQFLGALIKAAVSRQREFLADASAVQFTRNANGIAEALQLIGGAVYQSRMEHHGAHELGHLFFSDANSLEKGSVLFHPARWAWLATHPPLAERIKRVLPGWTGYFLKPDASLYRSGLNTEPDPAYPSFSQIQAKQLEAASTEVRKDALGLVADIAVKPPIEFVNIKPSLRAHSFSHLAAKEKLSSLVHHSYEASVFVLGLFLSEEEITQVDQFNYLDEAYVKNSVQVTESLRSLLPHLQLMSIRDRLELLELSMPALKMMSLVQYQFLKQQLMALIKVDSRVSIQEWLWYQLVTQYLDRHFGLGKTIKPRYNTIQSLALSLELVLSRVVYFGFEDQVSEDIDPQDERLAFLRAADVVGLKGASLKPLEACDGMRFSQALFTLAMAYPLLKPRIMKAVMAAIHFDEKVTHSEQHVVTAIAVIMDCPLMGLAIENAAFSDIR